jgi:hypothetical protein
LSVKKERNRRKVEFFNVYQDHEWVSVAALLLAFQPHRARQAFSQDVSLAGLGLLEASHCQIVIPLILIMTADPGDAPMADEIKAGTILIKDGTPLPEALRFESEPCAPGWRSVKNLNGHGLGLKIHEAGWTFFYMAGEINATLFGLNGRKTVHRAVEQILANPESEKFNSLEITRMVSVASKRFLGVTYVTVSAHSRQIQESALLFQAKEVRNQGPSKVGSPEPFPVFTKARRARLEETIMQPSATTILNL